MQHAVFARLHRLLRSHPLWCLLLDAPRICSQQQPAHGSSQQASGGTKTWRSCPLRGSQPRTPGTALSTALLNHNQFRYLILLQPRVIQPLITPALVNRRSVEQSDISSLAWIRVVDTSPRSHQPTAKQPPKSIRYACPLAKIQQGTRHRDSNQAKLRKSILSHAASMLGGMCKARRVRSSKDSALST